MKRCEIKAGTRLQKACLPGHKTGFYTFTEDTPATPAIDRKTYSTILIVSKGPGRGRYFAS